MLKACLLLFVSLSFGSSGCSSLGDKQSAQQTSGRPSNAEVKQLIRKTFREGGFEVLKISIIRDEITVSCRSRKIDENAYRKLKIEVERRVRNELGYHPKKWTYMRVGRVASTDINGDDFGTFPRDNPDYY